MSLWFVVPAHGREQLSRICLEQLRRTCDALEAEGVRASAVVIADDANLTTAQDLGFAWVERDNRFLGRKFNDGIQLALDPRYNPHPADYVVPCGSDDWVDHRLFLDLPDQRTMVGFQHLAVMREDGRELAVREVNYRGGTGIRIWPRRLLEPLGYRPADEDRRRGCDTSILVNVTRAHDRDFAIEHRHLHDLQIVDWKSPAANLNSYDTLGAFRGRTVDDPAGALAEHYPAEAVDAMIDLYASRQAVAA